MKPLFRDDAFLAEADSLITRVTETEEGLTALVFDSLLWYPGGGGQPKETTGRVVIRGQSFDIRDLTKGNGDVVVTLKEKIPFHSALRKGEVARQYVDIKRRLLAARYHTVQHVFGAAVRMTLPDYESGGMEILSDFSQCSMYFRASKPLTPADVLSIQEIVISAIRTDLPVRVVSYSSVEEVRMLYGNVFRLDSTLPPFKGRNLRTVVIGEGSGEFTDVSLCGGTHLHSLAEGGTPEIIGLDRDPASGEGILGY